MGSLIATIFVSSTSTALANANWVGAAPRDSSVSTTCSPHAQPVPLQQRRIRGHERLGEPVQQRGMRGFVGLPAHVAIMRK